MDNKSRQEAWNEICNKVKSYPEIDNAQVNAFFPRIQPQAMSDGFLMLTADNEFIKSWIERHYIEHIKNALQDVYGVPFTVLIEVDENQASNQPMPSSSKAIENSMAKDDKPVDISAEINGESSKKESESEKSDYLNQKIDQHQEGLVDNTFENTQEDSPNYYSDPTNSLTFGNFVIGDSNRMAYSMAVSVAEMPGKPALNPLFIYGRSGLGKTHLLRAIENYIHETLPHMKTVYVDSADLLNDYTEAAVANDREKQSYKNFKHRYEEADVLLIDDVQFFQGKKQTLDIVFQIFNKLTQQGKQVVLSADRAPKNIDVDERYQSRFSSGGICDIQPPEVETKLGVIKSFIEEYAENEGKIGFNIPNDIQLYIAENSSSNIRELKSAVTKVIYQIEFSGKTMDIDAVRTLLEDHFSGGISKRLTVGDIQKETEQFYKVTHAEIVGDKRSRNIMLARQVSIYLSRQILNLPYGEIGKKFNRDHSTIMYSVKNITEKMKGNRELKEEIEALRKIILEE